MPNKHVVTSILLATAIFFSVSSGVRAWFGAGKTPGFPATIQGLSAEIQLPIYKFSPDFYSSGESVSISTRIFNPTESPISTPVYFRLSTITEAPVGTDVSNGTPATPGINENQFFDYFNANSLVYSSSTSTPLGTSTLSPQGQTTVSATTPALDPGYYAFFFQTSGEPGNTDSGTILTMGFIRVLASIQNPSPTPQPTLAPTPTTSPLPVPTATPSVIQPASGKFTRLSLSTPTCSKRDTVATLEVLDGGTPVDNVLVQFLYASESKPIRTGPDGKASVQYRYRANVGRLEASPDQGFPSQSAVVEDAKGCPPETPTGQVLGTSTETSNGTVLGATSFGETGSLEPLLIMLWSIGILAMACGLAWYGFHLIYEPEN